MGDVYFADASALSKRYVEETGTDWLQTILDASTGCTVYIVRTSAVELMAALTRRERTGALSPSDAAVARAAFRMHLRVEYKLIEVTKALGNQAMTLAERYGLRGYDAIQLAAAIKVNASYRAAGLPPVLLLSADAELRTAATAEGLIVDNPNCHPCPDLHLLSAMEGL